MEVDVAREAFIAQFSRPPEVTVAAPGRVNLIGEHTDYNEGFVFPAAIDLELYLCAATTKGPSQFGSLELGGGEKFDANQASQGDVRNWSKYAAGMAWALREFVGGSLPNLVALVHSQVPIGSGVSSSAALELACGVAWNHLARLGIDRPSLARLGQRCENKFVGVNSGIMDQMACAMGREGHAIFLDTRSLEIDYAKIPAGLSIVLCDTGKARALADSAYNERRSQCEEACHALHVHALRDATLENLQMRSERMPEVVFRRARHVITENDRCVRFVAALNSQDLPEIGRLMRASHESLRDDYEVSCAELDAMAESAWAAEGCVGARMTGAGFGGACVALVESAHMPDFVAGTATAYKKRTGLGGNFMPCRASDGARVV